jgi:hypothetical protein
MATQERLAPAARPSGQPLSLPAPSNPLNQSTLATRPVDAFPGAAAADGGHWQPTLSQLPSAARKTEGSISATEKAVDSKLNICRGC